MNCSDTKRSNGSIWKVPGVESSLRKHEHRLDLHRNIIRQGTHPYCAAYSDAEVIAPDGREQFTASVDHVRVSLKIRCGINHAQYFDHPGDAVQASEVCFKGRQYGEPYLSCGKFSFVGIQVGADFPLHECAVRFQRPVTRNVYERSHNKRRLVYAGRFRRRRQLKIQLTQFQISIHLYDIYYVVQAVPLSSEIPG